MGRAPFRPGNGPSPPTLNYLFRETVDTPTGPAAKVESYLYIVCLPTPDGRWTARVADPVDDERAERRFLAYAWPAEAHPGTNTAFFVDEHERILVLDTPRGSPPPFLGAEHPPACEDATLSLAPSPPPGSAAWKVWKNKQPRKSLPGDTAEAP
jgi:hypothetical protein